MKKSILRKLKAVLCVLAGTLLTMAVEEAVFLLGVYKPFLEGASQGRVFIIFGHILWLYAWMYAFYRLTARHTTWWLDMDGKVSEAKEGGEACRL